jgi:hypothetical protein
MTQCGRPVDDAGGEHQQKRSIVISVECVIRRQETASRDENVNYMIGRGTVSARAHG